MNNLFDNITAMLLHDIRPSRWLHKKRKQLGRGNSSWKGNYSTKWLKWQKARSGSRVPAWFEGWQTPLTQRLPKLRWFKRHYKLVNEITAINLAKISKDEKITSWMTLDLEILVKFGYCKDGATVKIIWNQIDKNISFSWIAQFSQGAKKAIENAGGSIK